MVPPIFGAIAGKAIPFFSRHGGKIMGGLMAAAAFKQGNQGGGHGPNNRRNQHGVHVHIGNPHGHGSPYVQQVNRSLNATRHSLNNLRNQRY